MQTALNFAGDGAWCSSKQQCLSNLLLCSLIANWSSLGAILSAKHPSGNQLIVYAVKVIHK